MHVAQYIDKNRAPVNKQGERNTHTCNLVHGSFRSCSLYRITGYGLRRALCNALAVAPATAGRFLGEFEPAPALLAPPRVPGEDRGRVELVLAWSGVSCVVCAGGWKAEPASKLALICSCVTCCFLRKA